MVLQPDGVILDTGDTCNPGLHICVEKHIQIILPFVFLAETPIKHRRRERERERWDVIISCPAQCVTTHPDPDPSLRAPSHHQSQSLMVLPPPGLHCRVSFERLRGLFAVGCPPSKNLHETQKRRRGWLPVCKMLLSSLNWIVIFGLFSFKWLI